MTLKEELIGLRSKLLGGLNNTEKENKKIKEVSLSEKIDEYILWNCENMVKGNYTNYGESRVPQELRDLIEKIAVWYELRYPDYEVNRRMHCCGQEGLSINDIMFNENNYVNELLDEDSDVRALDWDEFFNASVFFKSLPWKERYRFIRAKYPQLVYIDSKKSSYLHLTSNGFVEEAEYIDFFSRNKISNEQLRGMHITEVIKLFKENGIKLPKNNELEKSVNRVENEKERKRRIIRFCYVSYY